MRKVVLLTLIMLFSFCSTVSADMAYPYVFTGWKQLDDNKIVFYTGSYAICVMNINTLISLSGTEKIHFGKDQIMDMDDIYINNHKYMIVRITNL